MTAFDKAWDLTKYSMDSRGEPNRVMSPSGRMRTGGNLPGPKDLNEFLEDMRYREAMIRDTNRTNADTMRGMSDQRDAAEKVLVNYFYPENRRMLSEEDKYDEDYDKWLMSDGYKDEPTNPRERGVDRDKHNELLSNLISALGLNPDIMSSGVYQYPEDY